MPRVKGGSPGWPRYRSGPQSSGKSAGVYSRRTGTPEMVENRARPCSSTLTPLGAPNGFSGAFSSVGRSARSAHLFSDSEGSRPRDTSALGLGTGTLTLFLSVISTADDRRGRKRWARETSDRLVGGGLSKFGCSEDR